MITSTLWVNMTGLRLEAVGLMLACLLLGGCRKQARTARGIACDCRVEPSPPRAGMIRAVVTLTSEGDRAPVTGARVRLEGNMTHPGMVPIFAYAAEAGPGRYEAPLELTMGGDWILTVTATLTDGARVRRRVDLPGVASR